MRSFMFAFVVAALARSASPGVIVVDAAQGPGFEFATVAQAIDAAADGDVLLVRQGVYGGTLPITINAKSLTIVADTAANVLLTHPLRIVNLAPTQSVVLRGLRIETATDVTDAIDLTGNLGTVWIEDTSVTAFGGRGALSLSDSAHCVVVRSAGTGGVAPSTGNSFGGRGCFVQGFASTSHLSAFESQFVGGKGRNGVLNTHAGNGGIGVAAGLGSALRFDGVTITGGPGGDQTFSGLFGPLFSGNGGWGLLLNPASQGPTGPITLRDTTLSGGAPGVASAPNSATGAFGQPLSDPQGLVTNLPGSSGHYEVESPGRAGQSVLLTLAGQANDIVLLFGAPRTGNQPIEPFGSSGPLLLSLPMTYLATIPLGPSGALAAPVAIPQLPAGIEGVTLVTQPIFLTAGGPRWAGGSAITVLAAGF
ncbi:MAG: hypothetical protein IPH13_03070 [Planctomycetes bacterium]|nr:hypothetical protein [Planctomycetota bacterium]MCC7170402.1 hypothetical protein [Planctomycetota bacterium]